MGMLAHDAGQSTALRGVMTLTWVAQAAVRYEPAQRLLCVRSALQRRFPLASVREALRSSPSMLLYLCS